MLLYYILYDSDNAKGHHILLLYRFKRTRVAIYNHDINTSTSHNIDRYSTYNNIDDEYFLNVSSSKVQYLSRNVVWEFFLMYFLLCPRITTVHILYDILLSCPRR